MDSATFDPYSSYSDSSAPHTPEPHPADMHYCKANVDDAVRNIFNTHSDDLHAEVHPAQEGSYWAPQSAPLSTPFYHNHNSSRGSLLQELYDEQQPAASEVYPDNSDNWTLNSHIPPAHQQQMPPRPHDYQMMRRNTFPTVRYDRDDGLPIQQYPPFMPQQSHHYQRPGPLYSEQLNLAAESAMPGAYHDASNIKLEDPSSIMVPSHSFFRSQSSGAVPPMGVPFAPPHGGLHVQHTDDAASKETQYLRRRCFNCHTTEPPSWRRSTLNPGKIVCNKCGLYERTHLRPRPLRFDELRAGHKPRKQSKGTVSPKAKLSPIVKKEPRETGLTRRSSISSSSGSVHSGSGASDWDDNGKSSTVDIDFLILIKSVSVYSTGSAPPTSFNSPNVQTFPLSRDSQSPPYDGGIRLPNAPLSDIASLQQSQQPSTPSLPSTPHSGHSSPGYYSPPAIVASPNSGAQSPEYFHRVSQNTVAAVPGPWTETPRGILSSPIPTPVAS
jgi:GATA-binding protein